MQRRTFLVFILCMLFFLVWMDVVIPLFHKPKPKPTQAPKIEEAPKTEQKPAESSQPVIQQGPAQPTQQPQEVTIITERFKAVLSTLSGGIKSLSVRHPDKNELIPLIVDFTKRPHSLFFEQFRGKWVVSEKSDNFVKFQATESWGEVENYYKFDNSSFTIDLMITIKTNSNSKEVVKFDLVTFNGIEPDNPLKIKTPYRYDQYHQAFVGRKTGSLSLTYYPLNSTKDGVAINDQSMLVHGIKNRYFVLALISKGDKDIDWIKSIKFRDLAQDQKQESNGLNNIICKLQTQDLNLSGKTYVYEYQIYAGPIRAKELSHAAIPLEALVDYSFIDAVGVAILLILNLFYSVFGNYGISIIFTTLLIRLILFPFSKKGQVSMYKMQKLQPKLLVLKERYKNDQRKFGQEQWKLYKEYKVNPFMGCLTLLVQLPIFIGMYSVLDISFDLRGSKFMLWMKDLSQPDQLFVFDKPVSLLFFTIYEFNLLPIVMTVAWFIQALTAPRSDDPQQRSQQQVMLFMPLFFGVMCYSLASGLSWYFLVNSLFGIVEQKLIKRFFLRD